MNEEEPQQPEPETKPLWKAISWLISHKFNVTPIMLIIIFIMGYLLGGQ